MIYVLPAGSVAGGSAFRCAEWGLPFGRQGHSLRSCPADLLRSPLTAGPAPWFWLFIGWRASGSPRSDGSFPAADHVLADGVLTLVVLSAPAWSFRDGPKEHRGEGGRAGRFVGPHVAGGACQAFTVRSARVHDADGTFAKRRRTEASDTRRDRPIFTESSCSA
jgi:hypothetical protein